jgi:hypothetical protein
MGALYNVSSNATNTASTTVPMYNMTTGGTKRFRVYHLMVGSDAVPANQAGKFQFARSSARGTSSTSITPNPMDPADGAFLGTYDTAWSGNPTITSASQLGNIAENQQATIQWMVDPKMGIVVPLTSGAGLALMAATTTSAANFPFSTYFEE